MLALLLLVHAAALVHLAVCQSPTVDETAHLPAGLSHWRFGRFELYRVNPPLVQGLAALPLLLTECREDWTRYRIGDQLRCEFVVGKDFTVANGTDVFRLYTLGRLACVPISLLGAWTCYRYAQDLYGSWSGVTAAALWCCCPNILANASLITPDAPAAALGALSVYTFWRWLRQPAWPRAVAAGVALGLCELAKMTWIILYALYPLLWWVVGRRTVAANEQSYRGVPSLHQLALMLGLSIYLINLCYLFDGSFRPLGDYRFTSQTLGGPATAANLPQNRFLQTPLARLPIPFPKDYVLGIDLQRDDFERGMWCYAAGQHQYGGWWWWYLYAVAVKTPIGLMLLAGFALLQCARSRAAGWQSQLVLLLPALVLFVFVSSQTGFTRYVRYVLPAAPLVYVWISQAAQAALQGGWIVRCGVVSAGLWLLASTAFIHPHEISYFNELAGGPENGHSHVVDANIDWGQELLRLKQWIDEHPQSAPRYFAYFDDKFCPSPDLAGIVTEPFPDPWIVADGRKRRRRISEYPAGCYAISVSYLRGYQHSSSRDPDLTEFLTIAPFARVGYAIHLYELPHPALAQSSAD